MLRDPVGTLVAVDFDGTLAEIVDDPASARPVAGAGELLERLAGRLGEVAVVSGRPLEFLLGHLGGCASVTLVGLYGLESRRGGRVVEHPDADPWRRRVRTAVASLAPLLPAGVTVEDKGLSATVHYRAVPERGDEVRSTVERTVGVSGLEVRPAKMSVELHPPLSVDKGTVLTRLAEERDGPVCFVGDDLGDLSAFDALDEVAVLGRATLRVAVAGAETPPELTARADVVVDGPADVLALLGGLVD
ncbi:MAG: trehalose-phosphatase [Acidobacteria bacterium]|nr:trehalose-phosphatase [Acidobacteriota bacterium]